MASNWSPPIVPNNGANLFNVRINGDPATSHIAVVPPSSEYAVNLLRIDAGDQLILEHACKLAVTADTIFNDGSLLFANGISELRFAGPELNLIGSGALELCPATRLRPSPGNTGKLNVGPGFTVRGAATIGVADLRLTNSGVLRADSPGTYLDLNLNPLETSVNDGLFHAVNGGTLTLDGGATLLNSQGKFLAGDGGKIEIKSGKIVGGELGSEGTGTIDFTYSMGAGAYGLTIVDSLINGNLRLIGGTLAGVGTLTNNGQLSNMLGRFNVGSPVLLLTGTGELFMPLGTDGDPGAQISAASPGTNRLINDSSHTIRGGGRLGQHSIQLTNKGLIRADQNGPLRIDLAPSQINYNYGLIEAVAGSWMTISNSGILDNTFGTLRAGGLIKLGAVTIVGGQLITASGVWFELTASPTTLKDTTLNGGMRAPSGTSLILQGTVTNNGLITADGAAPSAVTEIRIATNPVILTGSGSLQMTGYLVPARIRNNNAGVTKLINGAEHTISGAGALGFDTIGIVNDGTILADLDPGLTIDPSDARYFQNNGMLRVAGTGAVTLAAGPFHNQGSVVIETGRTMTRTGDYGQEAGSTLVNGTLTVNGGSLLMQGGTVGGAGRINGAVVNSAGEVGPGNGIGQLQIVGSYAQGGGGTLAVDLVNANPGTTNDRLNVVGLAELGGTLDISFVGGPIPPVGAEFVVLTATALQGRFATVRCPVGVQVSYTATQVIVRVTEPTSPADLNGDGAIDAADLDILLSDWGRCPGTPCTSDLNGDGIVDGADAGMLLGAWKRSELSR